MSPVAKMGKLVWACSCLACHLLNLFLAFIALGQAGLIVLNLVQTEVPLPDKLTGWVINQIGPEHLTADWENATFDLRGGIMLSRLTVRNDSTEQIIATAEESYIQWTPLHLLLKSLFPLRSIELRDVEIYIPVSHSPSGLNEPVLFIKNVSAEEDGGDLVVSSLILETSKIQVHLQGSAPIHLLNSRPERETGPGFFELLQTIRRLPEDLVAFADVEWKLFPSGDHSFQISGLMPALDYSLARLGSLSGEALIRLSDDGLSLLRVHLDGFLQLREEVPDLPLVDKLLHLEPIPFHLTADGSLIQSDRINLPTKIQLNLHPRDDSLPFHHLLLRTSYWKDLSPIHWIASSPRAFSEGWAHPVKKPEDSEETIFPFKLTFRGYLPDSSLSQLVPNLPESRLLKGARADHIQLNATFDPLSLSLQGNLSADGLFIGQTAFSRLRTHLYLDKTDLRLEDIEVRKSENQFASGSYLHHFPSSKFSLNATGSTFPTSLDIILGKWWTRIFTHIEASEPLPADVTVWGVWRDLKSLQSVTSVDGRNGYYRGVHIPHLQLRVRSTHKWAHLEHLKASFPEGTFGGKIAIRSGIESDAPLRAMVLDLESDAPWEALCAASGIEELCEIEFEGSPHVTVRGTLWQDSGKGFNTQAQADLRLGLVQHEGRGWVQGLELEGLTLSGRLKGQRLDLTGLTGRFAEGIFTGNIQINNWQSKENRSRFYSLRLVDGHFGSTRQQLSESFGYSPEMSATFPTDLFEGRIDAAISLYTAQTLEQARGTGSIVLRQAKLGQIHLFGGLSRFFNSMGLGFSSLNLDSLSFDWLLTDTILAVNNGLVTGPSLRLRLNGEVDLKDQELAMRADVNMVKGMLGMVLSPVSENLLFDLSGTLKDPQWEIRFTPFKWLQSDDSGTKGPTEL
jgi:hypothetical protein